MDFLLVSAVLLFVAISVCFLLLIKKQNQRASRFDRRNIKGAARGHMGMFCPQSAIEKSRKALLRSGTKF